MSYYMSKITLLLEATFLCESKKKVIILPWCACACVCVRACACARVRVMPHNFLCEMGVHVSIKAKHVTFLNFIFHHITIISPCNDLCG